jgi:hypothetical protein
MGAVFALALGIGLAATAQAQGINRQTAAPSPNIQSGSTEQMQQGQIRPQRQATRQVRHKRLALAHKTSQTRMAALKRHNRMQVARLHQKTNKTRLALHRQNRNQNVGVGSSMPSNGTGITPTTPNSAGGTPNLNTPTQNQ